MNYINYNLCYGTPEVYVQFLPKTSYMRAHLDNGRNAVVNVPLVPLNYDIIYHMIYIIYVNVLIGWIERQNNII